jgi:hypothetical protein
VDTSIQNGCIIKFLRTVSVGTDGDTHAGYVMPRVESDTRKERRMQWDLQDLRDTTSDGGRDSTSRIEWADFKFPALNLWNAPPSPEMLTLCHSMWYYKLLLGEDE